MKKAIVIAAAILLASCGEDDDSSSGGGSNVSNIDAYAPQPVSYSVDSVYGPTCNRASDVSESSSESVNCTWYCGTDNVYDHQSVSIDFVKTEGKWKKDRILVADGICS